MKASFRVTAALLAAGAVVACGRPTPVGDDLQADLAQATASAVELAPRAASTTVVSAIELGAPAAPKAEAPRATPQRRAPERAKAPARTQKAPVVRVAEVKAPEPEPQPVADTPAPVAEAPAPVAAAEPPVVSAPAPQPTPARVPAPSRTGRAGRGGGWWSTGDVIRNAPFPINP